MPLQPWATWKLVRRAALWPLVLAALAELICRVLTPIYLENPDPKQIEVMSAGYRSLRPGYQAQVNVGGKPTRISINQDGFRDLPLAGLQGCLMVGVGNSYVANWAIRQEDFWSTHLQARLAEGPNPKRCAVRSVGFQGWSLRELDAVLADRVLPHKPKVVVLAFNNLTMWPDVPIEPKATDAALAQWHAKPHPQLEAAIQPEPTGMSRVVGLYNELERHSALLGALKVYAPLLPMTIGLSQLAVAPIYRDEEFARRKQPTLASLDTLRRRIEAAGATLVVLFVPSLPEVDADVFDLMLGSFGGSQRHIDVGRPATTIGQWARDRGVAFVDLTVVFRGHIPKAMGYVDHHWNEVGNDLAAQVLEPVVRPRLPN